MRARAGAAALTITMALAVDSSAARADDAWLGRDKALHFGASATLAVGGYAVSAIWLEREVDRALTGAAVALAAGAGKELWDATGRGDPSAKDAAWDVIGTVVGVAVALIVDRVAGR